MAETPETPLLGMVIAELEKRNAELGKKVERLLEENRRLKAPMEIGNVFANQAPSPPPAPPRMGIAQQAENHPTVVLRFAPQTGEEVMQVPNGTELEILREDTRGNMLVSFQGQQGWARSKNIQKVPTESQDLRSSSHGSARSGLSGRRISSTWFDNTPAAKAFHCKCLFRLQRKAMLTCPTLVSITRRGQQAVFVIALLAMLAISIGGVMQEFLDVMTYKFGSREVMTMWTLWSFPWLVAFFSLVLHFVEIILKDALDAPPFANTRSLFAAAFLPGLEDKIQVEEMDSEVSQEINKFFLWPQETLRDWTRLVYEKGSRRDKAWMMMVLFLEQFWFTFVFTVFMIVGGVVRACVYDFAFFPTYLWGGAFLGACLWILVTMVMYAAADFIIHRRQLQHWSADRFRIRFKNVLYHNRIEAGDLVVDASFMLGCQAAIEFQKRKKGKTPILREPFFRIQCIHKCSEEIWWCGSVVGLLLVILGQGIWISCVQFIAQRHDWGFALGSLYLIPALIFVTAGFKSCIPSLHGYVEEDSPVENKPQSKKRTSLGSCCSFGSCNPCAALPATPFERYTWLFGILCFFLFLGWARNSQPSSPSRVSLEDEIVMFADSTKKHIWVNSESSGYPVCSMRWGRGTLGILDLVALAKYSYATTERDYDVMINSSFRNAKNLANCSRIQMDPYNITATSGQPRVVATYLQSTDSPNGTIVVAVKGSDQVQDFYADSSLYATIVVLQLASVLIPVVDILPNGLIANYLSIMRSPLTRRHEQESLRHVEKIVNKMAEMYPHASIVITGHSLGGGLAQAIGAKLRKETLVFSSPGAHFSRQRFQMNMEEQYRNLVNIVPDGDFVSKVDRHDAVAQRIECRDKKGNYKGWDSLGNIRCHLLQSTACELWRACGDFRERDFHRYCKDEVDFKKLGKYFSEADNYET